jgi:hypothetical protein
MLQFIELMYYTASGHDLAKLQTDKTSDSIKWHQVGGSERGIMQPRRLTMQL